MAASLNQRPRVILVGAGAAGLWTAMALIEHGWSGDQVSLVEPSGKTANDRTFSYWAKESLFPTTVEQAIFSKILLANGEERKTYELDEYRYFSLRSSHFYAYAKEVLAKAEVTWTHQKVVNLQEHASCVELTLDNGDRIKADFVLDSRPPAVEVPSHRYNATLQHFGGWFVKMPRSVFDPEEVVFMDFISVADGVAFFYVIPSEQTKALVEIAVFSENPWTHADYDKAIAAYLEEKYACTSINVLEKEYGVIPMTDQPLWRDSTERIWNIGTRAGWVQPASGYAFTRTARFANEVAERLKKHNPFPWKPSAVQQVFNSVMLGYIIDNPPKAGKVFYDLFAKNGPTRTFDFLDEASDLNQTIQLMWSSPKGPFTIRAIKESLARLIGSK